MFKANIHKKLKEFELDINVESDAHVLSILGPSGCGKSMTLKCIAGIEKPDSGCIMLNDEILYDDRARIDVPSRKRRVGLLFQDYALFPNMNVIENIKCVYKDSCGYSVDELLEKFRIKDIKDSSVTKISGGQKQRVALARMIGNDPKVYIFDEPFSALDSHLRWSLEKELTELFDELKKRVIYVSHSRDEVYRFSDEIIVMDKGVILEHSKKKDLFSCPKTVKAAQLTGCKNFSKIICQDGKFYAKDFGAPLSVDCKGKKYLGYRAHNFEITDRIGDNTLVGHVERCIENVFSFIVIVRTLSGYELVLEMDKPSYERIKDLKDLIIRMKVDDMMFFEE